MVDNAEKEFLGCGSNSCYLEKPRGIGTNGSCSCFKELPFEKRVRIEKTLQRLRDEIKS